MWQTGVLGGLLRHKSGRGFILFILSDDLYSQNDEKLSLV